MPTVHRGALFGCIMKTGLKGAFSTKFLRTVQKASTQFNIIYKIYNQNPNCLSTHSQFNRDRERDQRASGIRIRSTKGISDTRYRTHQNNIKNHERV